MRAGATLALLLAACGDSGLAIEIAAGSDATHVEVFFVNEKCEACGGAIASKIGAANNTRLPAELIWHPSSPRFLLEVENGVAQVKIETAKEEYFARAYFVAFAGEMPTRVARLDNFIVPATAKHIQLELAPIRPISGTIEKQPEGLNLEVWRKAEAQRASCIVYERWSKDGAVDREMIVANDDFDCDDVEAMTECDKTWFKATQRAGSLADATCLTEAIRPPGITARTCVFAGDACTDGVLPMPGRCDSAVSPTTCAPDALCVLSCSTAIGPCVETDMTPYVECVFATTANNAACPNKRARLDLGALRGAGPATCTGSLTFAQPSITRPMFTQMIAYPAGGPTLTAGMNTNGCNYDLVLGGSLAVDRFGLVKARFTNGAHVVMPIHIKGSASANCDAANPVCTIMGFNPQDGITNCALAP